jgi:hypothetical protein
VTAEPTTPVAEDVHATVPELHARAAADYAQAQADVEVRETQGGNGIRQGVLPGSTR